MVAFTKNQVFFFPRICSAILSAVFAPFGLDAAKHNAYSGLFREFLRISGFDATSTKTVLRRWTKNIKMSWKSASFFSCVSPKKGNVC